MDDNFLESVSHRPFPVPSGPWRWRQRWDSVLLLHFRVASVSVRALLAPRLALDEMDGSAWVSVVPFRMRNVRPRYLPAIGPLSNFTELNVRTYVRAEGKPGVFFLSIHARGALVAWLARSLSPLGYRAAALDWHAARRPEAASLGAGAVSFRSPLLDVDFASGGPLVPGRCTPLDTFLTERYCLYAATRAGVVQPDLVHLSPGVEVVAWPSVPVGA